MKDNQEICTEPTDQDFLNYVYTKWPLFMLFHLISGSRLVWGWVKKKENELNEINILSSIILVHSFLISFNIF